MSDQFDYDLFQQIFCLSMATGIVSDQQGPEAVLQNAMKKSLTKALPKLPGKWSISWGPRILKEKNKESEKGGPDNVWFAAVEETQRICVVAIAGTASNSWADIYQDFDVWAVVNFDEWVQQWSSAGIPRPESSKPDADSSASLPWCAKGACVGVWNVLSNVSTEPGEDTRIDQYLQSLPRDYTIVVTGHSLGGALAPVAALGLARSQLTSHEIKVLPSAGVSPGNEVLAMQFASEFPHDRQGPKSYEVFNVDYHNIFDIVPQAWSVDPIDDRNLNNILGRILHCDNEFRSTVEFYVNIAFGLSKSSQIRYTPLPGQSFAGPPPPTMIKNWDQVKEVLSTEHVLAYWDETDINEFMRLFDNSFKGHVQS
ncbi:hypothetical protein F4808DRAFT_239716 [Astrocystis sublimbata]|nr:hypothetical protein F4808DRAFT_239716 [Astrocystis sublimbata]